MAVGLKQGVDVVISLGSPRDGEVIKARMEGKDSHRRVEVITIGAGDLGKPVDPNSRVAKVLAEVDEHSRITIVGHSSARGSVLQADQMPGQNAPIAQRTYHFSEVTEYIAQRIDRTQFGNPDQALEISLRSCYGGYGEDQSLAAKMQRQLLLANGIYCNVNAREGLVFVDNPNYTMDPIEYAARYARQAAGERARAVPAAERKSHYALTPEMKPAYNQSPGSKMRFTWNKKGEQCMDDAYAIRKKFKRQLSTLSSDLKALPLNIGNIRGVPHHRQVGRVDKAIELYFSEGGNTRENAKNLLTQLRNLEEDLLYVVDPSIRPYCKRLKQLVAYAEKHLLKAPEQVKVGAPVTVMEIADYQSHEQIVAEKLKGIEEKLLDLQGDAVHAAFHDPNKGFLTLIRNYYLYQLRYELETEHVDAAIGGLERWLGDFLKYSDQREDVLSPEHPEVRFLHGLVRSFDESSASEGMSRAANRGLAGVSVVRELIKACERKRTDFAGAFLSQLDQLINYEELERVYRHFSKKTVKTI